MFISRLIDKILAFDPYGIGYWHGMRGVFAFLALCAVNYFYSVDNPFFYFFYLPMACLSIEMLGESFKEKIQLYIITVTWAAVTVVIFGLCSTHKMLLLFVVFSFSMFVYVFFARNYKHPLVLAPTVLSLGAFSLNYHFANVDLCRALYHFGIMLFAGTIICAVLVLFPKHFIFKIWYRIFYATLCRSKLYLNQEYSTNCSMGLMQTMGLELQYASMLTKNYKCVLRVISAHHKLIYALVSFIEYPQYFNEDKLLIHDSLAVLSLQVKQCKPCYLTQLHNNTEIQNLVHALAKEWNKLCAIYFFTK